MARRLADIVRQIDHDLKPTLKSTAEHRGFCMALAEFQVRLGPDILVAEPGDYVLSETPTPLCPDCDQPLSRELVADGTSPGPVNHAVWFCTCDGPVDEEAPAAPDKEGDDADDHDAEE